MKCLRILFAVPFLALVAAPGGAEDGAAAEKMLGEVSALLASKDSYAAAEHVESLGPPPVVAQAYDQLVRDLYWKKKDVRGVVALGRAGILYCLTKSREVRDPAAAPGWRTQAKAIAYNVGSFTWPGWGEEGATPTEAEVRAGREAAILDLRLAEELGKPEQARSAAYWLVGAHELAAGEFAAAAGSFGTAGEHSRAAKDPDGAGMADGYVALARVLAEEAGAEAALEESLRALGARGTEDAKFYAEQIRTARKALGEWLSARK